MEGTIRCSANYVSLSPISFLLRSGVVYSNRISIVYGDVKFTWAETRRRCLQLASAFTHLGISRGDVVCSLPIPIWSIDFEVEILRIICYFVWSYSWFLEIWSFVWIFVSVDGQIDIWDFLHTFWSRNDFYLKIYNIYSD